MLWKNFDHAIDTTTELAKLIGTQPNITHIRNVVSTVNLLDKDEKLSLESIASTLGGMCKFRKKGFAAIVMRIKDRIGTTTCLVFRSGKLVVVGAVSWHHALLSCQMYRTFIERVKCPYQGEDGHIVVETLMGRTKFEKWGIWNLVSSMDLGCRPDLKVLTELLTDIAAWNPELFPGLKLLTWLRPKDKCKCTRRKKNGSCACNSRALIFDSGKVVMTGCKNMEDIALTRLRIRALIEDDTFLDHNDPLPRKQRFEARRKKLLQAAEQVEFCGSTRVIPEKRSRDEEDWEAETKVIRRKYKNKKSRTAAEDLSPFVKACVWGQEENVAFILSYDQSQRAEALREMEKLSPEDRNENVMKMLQSHKMVQQLVEC